MDKKSVILLLCIFSIGIFLRFYRLGSVPPSPSLDEVSIGYNAYSILKTGADEYGYKFPILLRAYDDWRPALYVYSVIPFIPFFGLSAVAVRLPAAIFGMLAILGTYFLVVELLKSQITKTQNQNGKKNFIGYWKLDIGNSRSIALLGALLLAISPWHIYLSRLGHEVGLGLTLFIWGTYIFIRALRDGHKVNLLFVSAMIFVLSLYAYQSEKIVTPLIVTVLAFLYRDKLAKYPKKVLLSGLLGTVLILPLLWATLTSPGLIRLQATNAFTPDNPRYIQHAQKYNEAKANKDIPGLVVYNRRLVPFFIFSSQYLAHFSPQWLFTGGPRESHKVPGLGLLYLWEAPFILLGIVILLRAKIQKRIKLLIIFWLLIAPLPGAVTTQAPHAMRSYTFLPMWQVLGALGLAAFAQTMSIQRKKAVLALIFAGILFAGSSLKFYTQYFFVFPATQSDSFQYALARSLTSKELLQKDYDRIIVSNKDNLYQSYMFYLFFHKIEPAAYQTQGGTRSGGYAETHTIGIVEFRPINWAKDRSLKNTLFFANPGEIPVSVATQEHFNYLDGKPGIVMVKNN